MSFTVLIVDDEEHARINIGMFLKGQGYEVYDVETLAEARQMIRQGKADIILLDVQLPDGYGPTLLEETARLPVRPPVIMITGFGDIDMAVDAMKNGAHDFIQKPVHFPRLDDALQRAGEIVSLRRELAHMRQAQHQNADFHIGDTPAMRRLIDQAQRAATAAVSVLITGETGTGKELLARAIHRSGPRADKPFIDINCAAIQPTVIESELFGYEAGAFTGAEKRKHGLMEVADGGILFLDEIASMPLDMQVKLLRAIQERAFRRVGGTNLIKVDVQIVSASNRNLQALMRENKFREDLYYRLKVVDLDLPPLRERREDIPHLVGLFIRKFNQQLGMNVLNVTPRALHALTMYHWPGNIRELHNTIERAVLFCDEESIDLHLLPAELQQVTPV